MSERNKKLQELLNAIEEKEAALELELLYASSNNFICNEFYIGGLLQFLSKCKEDDCSYIRKGCGIDSVTAKRLEHVFSKQPVVLSILSDLKIGQEHLEMGSEFYIVYLKDAHPRIFNDMDQVTNSCVLKITNSRAEAEAAVKRLKLSYRENSLGIQKSKCIPLEE